nr:MAG TPA: flagellin [Caudoviricetes sp.]
MFGAISAVSKSHQETEKKLDSIRELAHDAKEQTTNNHGTNLRDDIDKLDEKLDHIAQTQSLLGQELTAHGHVLDQLQAAQRQDRSERMTLDSQAHDEHERLWKELDRIKNRL